MIRFIGVCCETVTVRVLLSGGISCKSIMLLDPLLL
jgi:hypothetical protein